MTSNNRRLSQNTKVFEYIKKHGSITSMEAIQKLRITRLSARISDLKGSRMLAEAGLMIKSRTIEVLDIDGSRCRVSQYYFDKVVDV